MFFSSDSVFFFSFSNMIEKAVDTRGLVFGKKHKVNYLVVKAKKLLFAALQLQISDEIDMEIRQIPEIKRPHTVDNLFNSPLRQ